MSLREKQKKERSDRIIAAAEQLIRETGGTDFTVRMLAKNAEVSHATPYNIFETKEGILAALMLKSQDQVITNWSNVSQSDPLNYLVQSTKSTANGLISDKLLLRPLCRALLNASDSNSLRDFKHSSFDYWTHISRKGVLGSSNLEGPPTPLEVEIGHALFTHFTGVVQQWVNGNSNDDIFRLRTVYGSLLIAANYVSMSDKKRLGDLIEATVSELFKLNAKFSKDASFAESFS